MESDEENEDGNKDVEEPAFLLADKKEPFYVKDPHKALRNFYNKEGMYVKSKLLKVQLIVVIDEFFLNIILKKCT